MPPKSRPSFKDFFPYATMVQTRLAALYQAGGISADEVKTTVALDVSYTKEKAFAAAVAYRVADEKVVEVQTGEYGVYFPYIPGYLYLREAPALLRVLAQIETPYDLVLVDAHGRLHPRRAGLATVIGVLTERPTLGIAKSLLVGEIRGTGPVRPIYLKGVQEGWYVKGDRPFYASPGNKMPLDEIRRWLRSRKETYPRELVEADSVTKQLRASSEAEGPA